MVISAAERFGDKSDAEVRCTVVLGIVTKYISYQRVVPRVSR